MMTRFMARTVWLVLLAGTLLLAARMALAGAPLLAAALLAAALLASWVYASPRTRAWCSRLRPAPARPPRCRWPCSTLHGCKAAGS